MHAKSRISASVSATAVVIATAGLLAAGPSAAADCPDSTAITSNLTCTITGPAGQLAKYDVEVIGAGGGSNQGGDANDGGSGAIVTATLEIPTGSNLAITIGRGGATGTNLGPGSGGGGSTGLELGSTLLVEAGGGGGVGNYYGGGSGAANNTAAGGNAADNDYSGSPCLAPGSGGQGAPGTGAPGDGGLASGGNWTCSAMSAAGSDGQPASSDGSGGAGGATGLDQPGGSGGNGLSPGGNGGFYEAGDTYSGGGGGGGYGGGGGGTGDGSSSNTGGGAGGSYVNADYLVGSAAYAPSAPGSPGGGGDGAAAESGSDGQVTLTLKGYVPDESGLSVNALSASTKLPRAGRSVLVRSATISPAGAGAISSISVRCRPVTRGDIRWCVATSNRKTGRVVVHTLGMGKVRITVVIKTRSKSDSYQPQRWARTWTTR